MASQLVRGETRDTASSSLQVNFSLRYAVQVIGEAANHLTDGMKRKNAHIPWIQIVGMRHRLVHDYSAVNFDVLWDTTIDDIPNLITELRRILQDL